ncbi:extracellular solute-binding protein [Streptomyces sp. NPDC050421]|uniref:extracellular solute-binding protein n=1 Tax=unclassified Streptomyces TaxID=2593676 RepID=UPI0037B19F2E
MTKPVFRKSILTTVAITAGSLALSSCGLGGSADSAGGDISKPSVSCDVPQANLDDSKVDTSKPTGTIKFATQSLKTDFGPFFEGLIAKFEKQHPGTNIVWNDAPTDTDFDSRMVSDARTCVMADVVNVPSTTIMALSKGNLLLDLDVKSPGVGKPFLPAVWDNTAFGAHGHHTALPWYWAPSITTYNKDVLKRAGLDENKPPKDWDGFVEMAKAIDKKSGGKDQALWGNPTWSFVDQWVGMGAKLMSDDRKEFTFAEDAMVKQWLTDMRELYKAGAIPKDSVTGKPDPSQAFLGGHLAFGSPNPSFLRNVKKNGGALYERTGVGEHLTSKGGKVLFDGQYLAVSAMTKNAPLALAWAEFVTNAENQLAWNKDPGVVIFPTVTEALEDPFFSKPDTSTPLGRARATAAKAAREGTADPANFYITGQIKTAVMQGIQLAMTGQKNPEEALQEAQKEANRLVRALG